jgi:hypothetical protein
MDPRRFYQSIAARGGGGFSPLSFGADLVAWYKADAGAYVDAGITLATNGQDVQQWNDQSGNGNHVSQANGTFRPTYLSAGLNGRPTLDFIAANDVLISATDALDVGGTALSTFTVATLDVGAAAHARLLSFLGSGDANDFGFATSACLIIENDQTQAIATHRQGYLGITSITYGTVYALGSIYDGVNATVYVNNSGSSPAASSGTFASTGTLRIGQGSGGEAWDGFCSEVVIVKKALSSDERNALHAYLAARWGL